MKKGQMTGILLLLPSVAFIFGLMLYPAVQAIILSFYNQTLYESVGKFVGFANYVYLWHLSDFLCAFLTGFIWVGGTVGLQLLLGMGTALLLNKKFVGRGFTRACVMLPFFMPGVSIFLLWRWMYNDQSGIINHILLNLGIIDKPVLWLASPGIAVFAVIFMASWCYFPFVTINILARLQSIELQLHEAAKIDGANFLQSFTYVTLPQLRTVILVVVMLRAMWMFTKFTEIWVVTGGGPAGATTTLPITAYNTAFGAMQMGQGSAVSTILFITTTGVLMLYITLLKPARVST